MSHVTTRRFVIAFAVVEAVMLGWFLYAGYFR